MKKIKIIVFLILTLALSGCGGCSSTQNDSSWFYDPEYYGGENEYAAVIGNAMQNPVEVEVSQGITLADAGREVYSDLSDLENRYNFGGVKLCAEMSADRQGKWASSFWQNTTVSFCPPPDLHLHKIFVADSSSNIICRIINGEISAIVGNVQNDIYRLDTEQPAFIVNIAASNRTADSIPVVIPLGQMLEVQAPDVQNIVVCKTYSTILAPHQSKTFNVRAYCGAEKRRDPSRHSAKLTPFVLTAPAYVYDSQSKLWNFQRSKKANDKIYTITFYAWGSGSTNSRGEKSDFGHAFVDIPEIGTVGYSGMVSDETHSVPYAKYKSCIKINETSLRKVQNKYKEWRDNPPEYKLMRYDCTTFAMDIADAAGIYYGPRWTIQSPAYFLRELIVYNKYIRYLWEILK